MKFSSQQSRRATALKIAALTFFILMSGSIKSAGAAGPRPDATFNTGTIFGRGVISAITVQPDGKTLIGGFYTMANGTARANLVRVNADGSLDASFNNGVGPNSEVNAIAIRADGKIMIGGRFTFVNGVARNRIARLNADGSLDASFAPGTGASSTVYAIALTPDNDIYVGGLFITFNGISRGRIARLNEDGSVDPEFNPGTGANTAVYDIKLLPADGRVIIGGAFSTYNGTVRRKVARLTPFGILDPSFVSGLNNLSSAVYSLALHPSGKLNVGGHLADGSSNPAKIVQLNADGSVDNSFAPVNLPSTDLIQTLRLLPDGKLLAGGKFGLTNGRRNIARFNANGTLDETFFPGLGANAPVKALTVQADGKILIGGDFYHFNGDTDNITSVVRLNADGMPDASFAFHTRKPGVVNDLAALPNGKTIIVGDFLEINGARQYDVARLNTDGSHDMTFNPLYGMDGLGVYSLAVQADGKLVIGGNFTYVNFQPRANIARLSANGAPDTSFNPGADSDVHDIEILADNKILVGGYFTNMGGMARTGIARINADGNLDLSFNLSTDVVYNAASDLTVQPDGKIIVAGLVYKTPFTLVGITRLNADGSLDGSFNVGTGANDFVMMTQLQPDGKILMGGWFTTVNGISRNRIARLNTDGSVDTSFNPGTGANSGIMALALQPGGKILAGGVFTSVNGLARTGLARFNPDGTVDGSLNLITGGAVEAIRLQPDGKILLGGTGLPSNRAIVRLLIAGAPFDFDSDGKTDIAVFRPSTNYWYITQSSNNAFRAELFGAAGDKIVPGDYDGDGKTDTAVFRPSTGYWYLVDSSNGGFRFIQFGQTEDIPATGDYDGDGKTDIAVFRPSTGTFYILYSSDGAFHYQQWGTNADQPVMGDYDSDGLTDFAIYRPSASAFYILRSSDGGITGQQWGTSGDVPVAADFDGDGKTEIAVYRPSAGAWYYLQSSDNSFRGISWGASGDIPVAGDYDADGKADIAVFRPSAGVFYILQSTNGALRAEQFGTNGDMPVPAAYVP